MTSILQSSLSPTQVRDTSKQYVKEFQAEVMDDNNVMVPVTITYDYRHYYGLGWEILVTGFDYTEIPNIGKVDLRNEVKRLIEEEEKITVHFEF